MFNEGVLILKFLLFIIFTTTLFSSNDLLQLDPHKKNILVLHSWHDILWDREWGKGLDNILGKKYNLIRYDFDAMRQDDKILKERAQKAWQLAKKYEVVGVVFGDDQALKYAGPLFQGTKYPGVYLGINFSPRKYLDYSIAGNITGVLERPLYKTSIKKLFKIFDPLPKKVLLLSDSALGEEDITDLAKLFKDSNTIKIYNTTLEFQVQDTWEKWQKAVEDAPKNGFEYIMVGSRYILRDKDDHYIEPEAHLLKWMTVNSSIPVFGFYEDGIGSDLDVGGWVLGGIEHGEAAGKIMYDILEKGKDPSEINPLFYNFGQYIFSRTLLKKYGLTLPKEIAGQSQYIEDRHDLYDFKKYSFDRGDNAWTPSYLYHQK